MEVAMQQRLSQIIMEVADPSHAGQARRAAVECAESLGLGESDCGAVAIAVTEMATNLVKHAGVGKIICEPIAHNRTRGLRVVTIDKGPGIRDIANALEDGYSTSGTSGNGLGAVRRLSANFDIYSMPGHGTCVLAEFWPERKIPVVAIPLQLGAISVALRGESVCGDGWALKSTADTQFILVVDGLGHGTYASEAAREAEQILMETDSISPAAILRDCHDALKKTRGAAGAIAAVSKEKGIVSFAGVGNISGTLVSGTARRGMASHNGILGHQIHKLQEFNFPWNDDSILIMHSDGVGTKWELNHYPGIANRHSSLIAAVLYRDFNRERDDATVLVAKNVP
jgi:anti-sigma regulatory factor (Ser/Thr protein kinase)